MNLHPHAARAAAVFALATLPALIACTTRQEPVAGDAADARGKTATATAAAVAPPAPPAPPTTPEPPAPVRPMPVAPAVALGSARAPVLQQRTDRIGFVAEAKREADVAVNATPLRGDPHVTTRKAAAQPVHRVADEPVSTFSIDVDTGSYASVRGLVRRGLNVPADAVRVEEMLNYFAYDYPRPERLGSPAPFAVSTELTPSPWNDGKHLLRIGLQASDPAKDTLPPANLVFLVDVSGSMSIPQSLPLVKDALLAFTDQLREQDHVSIVTYAGSTQVALESTSGAHKDRIKAAIAALHAGGSTAGASGIRLAYEQARRGFMAGGINRILLATDGDFNVGVTDIDQLKGLVAAERQHGIGLSTLGVGDASYNDALMEQIADVGDGKYSFLDSPAEARHVLVDEFTSTLATVARDVKVQIEFNPAVVQEYRLVGYDNRVLARADFGNDKVDAGDIGAGHRVTALYEVVLAGGAAAIERERYAANRRPVAASHGDELGFLRLRYKAPGQDRSALIEQALAPRVTSWIEASGDTRFASAVAGWAQWLQGGAQLGRFTPDDVVRIAETSLGADPQGLRREFVQLVRELAARQAAGSAPRVAGARPTQ